MSDQATGTEVIRIPADHNIDPVWQGFTNAFIRLPAHDHMVGSGGFSEVFQVGRQVPGYLPVDPNHRVRVHCDYAGYFHITAQGLAATAFL
jgi:hypothetical protein